MNNQLKTTERNMLNVLIEEYKGRHKACPAISQNGDTRATRRVAPIPCMGSIRLVKVAYYIMPWPSIAKQGLLQQKDNSPSP